MTTTAILFIVTVLMILAGILSLSNNKTGKNVGKLLFKIFIVAVKIMLGIVLVMVIGFILLFGTCFVTLLTGH